MPNKRVWETDGLTLTLYADDVLMLQLPLATLSSPPDTLVARDAATGLPAWVGIRTALADAVPLDTGTDGIPPDTVITTVPVVVPTIIPEPVIDNCPQIKCGAAHLMAVKLLEEYGIIKDLLQFMLTASFIFRAGPRVTDSRLLVSLLKTLLVWLTKAYNTDPLIIRVISNVLSAVVTGEISGGFAFEEIGDAGREQLAFLAYISLECVDNQFQLTPIMLGNWGARILRDDVDFTEWQRHLLVYCIQATPFYVYYQTAANGAQSPSDLCGTWSA